LNNLLDGTDFGIIGAKKEEKIMKKASENLRFTYWIAK
jgi:hypothetical protein